MLQLAAVGRLCQQHVLYQGVVQPRMAAVVCTPATAKGLRLFALRKYFAKHPAQCIAAAGPLNGTGVCQILTLA